MQLSLFAGQRNADELTLMECYAERVRPVRACGDGTLSGDITALKWFMRLVPDVAVIPFKAITSREMAIWRAAWVTQTGLKPQTFNKHLRHVRAILNELVNQDLLIKAPRCKPLPEVDPDVRVASTHELKRLYDHCEGAKWPPPESSGVTPARYWQSLIVTGYTTGLRRSDILTIRPADIDRRQRLLTYRACKTKKLRTIPVMRETIDELTSLLKVREPQQSLFYSTSSKRQFYREWHAIQERAGIAPKIDVHDLRSTCCSMVYKVAGLNAASELLAHSSLGVTRKHYVGSQTAAESLRVAVDQLPSIARIG